MAEYSSSNKFMGSKHSSIDYLRPVYLLNDEYIDNAWTVAIKTML